jgi:hypothetical protein
MTNAQAALIAAATLHADGSEYDRARILYDASKFLDWLNTEDAEAN